MGKFHQVLFNKHLQLHNIFLQNSVDALITDPPYYDAVPYAHLSDFFYVWLKQCSNLFFLIYLVAM